MGNDQSQNRLTKDSTAVAVSEALLHIGTAYTGYSAQVLANGIDGAFLFSLVSSSRVSESVSQLVSQFYVLSFMLSYLFVTLFTVM